MSREADVLENNFNSLCSAIQDPLKVAEELYAEELVSSHFVDDLRARAGGDWDVHGPDVTRRKAAVKLLTAVDQQVSRDATKLHVLLSVLKDCLRRDGRAAEAVQAMEKDYGQEGDQLVSIQHARTVLRLHLNSVASTMTVAEIHRAGQDLLTKSVLKQPTLDDIVKTMYSSAIDKRVIVEQATRLVGVVQDEIAKDPRNFAVFVGILKDNPSTDQTIVALMEAEYCKSCQLDLAQSHV